MEQHTFVDGIGRVAIIDGIVRVDFITHSPTEMGPDGKPRLAFAHRIVMGTDQFLRAAEKIAETVRVIQQHQGQPQQTYTPPPQNFAAQPQQPPPPVQPVPPQSHVQPVPPLQAETSFGRRANGQAETPPPPPARPFP